MTDLLILAVAGLGAWGLRASAIVASGDRPLPDEATRALAYAKHAVLAALVGAALANSGGTLGAIPVLSPQLFAAAAAAVVAWTTGGTLRTLVAGTATASVLAAAWPG